MKTGKWNIGRKGKYKGKKFPVEVLTPAEMERLIKGASNCAPTGIRNRAMLVLGYRAGLRLGEVLALYPKDIDMETGVINILRGKGNKQRIAALDLGGCAVLQRWIDKRERLGFNSRQPLFCTLKGEPVKASYVRAMMKRLAKRAGIEKRVHFHSLRHAFTSSLAGEGAPMVVISGLLGHAKFATTERYLKKVAPQVLIDTIRKREWKL